MGFRDELRDPWGWLVAGISGGLGWAVLAGVAAGPAAVIAGVGIGAAVLGTKVAIGSARRAGTPELPAARRDRLPQPPADSIQAALRDRAEAAVRRIGELADRPADPWIGGEVRSVLADSRAVVSEVEEMAGRVTVLDTSLAAARPESLAREIAELQVRIAGTSDEHVRAERQRALAALDAQAESVERLLRRRDALIAQMQAAAVGLEGLAARSGELVALGPASQDTEAAGRIVADLTSSLDSVRAGVEEARTILRDL